jgi:hypothetical protein
MSLWFDSSRERWVIEVDRYVDTPTGKTRLRKTKMLPATMPREHAEQAAVTFEAKLLERYFTIPGREGWDAYVDRLVASKGSWLYATVDKCRHRAAAKGQPFRLTTVDVETVLRRSRGRCEVTGMAFSDAPAPKGMKRPYHHSIDRVDSSLGYTGSNVRVVCFAVNMAMANWGEAVFEQLAAGYVLNKYGVTAALQRQAQSGQENPPTRLRKVV